MPLQIKLIHAMVNISANKSSDRLALKFDSVDKQTVCNYDCNLVLIFSIPLQVCALQGQ